ncbi:MAG: hypothetical protein IJ634_01935 [Bacteroidales bacterium]|nr:hypothetical protein [Bacteroidales bacterium]
MRTRPTTTTGGAPIKAPRGKYRQTASKPMAEDVTYVIDIIRNNWKNGQGILVGFSGAELADTVVEASGGTLM